MTKIKGRHRDKRLPKAQGGPFVSLSSEYDAYRRAQGRLSRETAQKIVTDAALDHSDCLADKDSDDHDYTDTERRHLRNRVKEIGHALHILANEGNT